MLSVSPKCKKYLIPENFDSVKNLAEYVARKLEAATLAEALCSSFDLEETYYSVKRDTGIW